MGFQGKFRDLSLVDILQVVQMTQKSGVLDIFDGPRHASVVFREGKIVDARPQGLGRLTDDLETRGLIPKGVKDEAGEGLPGEAIGERLVRLGHITADKLREVLVHRVESTVYETLSWVNGQFDFEIVEPGDTGPALLALADVLPGVNFNTQQVLMDALRVFDERRAGRATAATPEAGAGTGEVAARASLGPRVVVCGPTGFSDRLRIALRTLKAQLVELPTLDLVVAELQSDSRRAAVVVLSVDRRRPELREEIGRALLAAKRVVVLTTGDDPTLADECVGAGAWAHVGVLESDPGPALSYLQTLVASRLDALAVGRTPIVAARAPAPIAADGPLGGFSMKISDLRDRLDALSGEVHTSSVSMKILEFVAERLDRGVLFLVRPGDLQGLGAFGHSADGDPIGPLASALRLPLDEGSPFRRVLDRRETILCELEKGAATDLLYGCIGRPNPPDALLLPLTSLGNAVALIYADNGVTGRPISEHAELEVMIRQAGLVLENALLRRMLEKKSTLSGPVTGGT